MKKIKEKGDKMERKIYLILLSIFLIMAMAVPCAADSEYIFYDDNVSVTIPDDYDADEMSGDYSYCDEFGECSFYNMFRVTDSSDTIEINGIMVESDTDGTWNCRYRDSAYDMYKESGKTVLKNYIFMSDDEDLNISDEEYVMSGTSYGYIRGRVSANEYMYITYRGGGQFYIFDVYVEDDDVIPAIDKIVNSFADRGFYANPEEMSDGAGFGIGALIFALAVILYVIISAVRANGNKPISETIQTLAGDMKLELHRIQNKESSREYEDAEEWTESKTVHTSYEESLHTLYKSGLLTKKEMNEMLAKHRK